MSCNRLADRVRDLRESRGWTQQQLADMVGLPQPRICEIETGTVKSPRIDTLQKLASVLGASLGDLCGEP